MTHAQVLIAEATARRSPPIAGEPADHPPFNVDDLRPTGLAARLAGRLLANPRPIFRLLRRAWPVAHLPFTDWYLITRADHVRAILADGTTFPVPFGSRMRTVNDGGPSFLLGLEDGEDYRDARLRLMACLTRADVGRVRDMARAAADECLAEHTRATAEGVRMDAVQDLILRVPALICRELYGLAPVDPVTLAHWSIAVSTYLFGDPGGNPAVERAALAAASRLRSLIAHSIVRARAGETGADTLVGRLLARQASDPSLTDAQITADLLGMIAGFVPTNIMAAGNGLDFLLSRPEALEAAQRAATARDDIGLARCFREAARFAPINAGPFRACPGGAVIENGGPLGRTGARIKRGGKLLVATQSAMFDPASVDRPEAFDPRRSPETSLMFGAGLHWCLGAHVAEAQIVATLAPLLRHRTLRRERGKAGRMQRLGPFPEHLWVTLA